MRHRLLLALGLALTSLLLLFGGVAADDGGRRLTATLAGAGSGSAEFVLNPGQGTICYTLSFEGLETPAFAAHIHALSTGQVVVPLSVPSPQTTAGTVSACTTAPRDVIVAILSHPEEYYVNVHNATHPGGAIRGTLTG